MEHLKRSLQLKGKIRAGTPVLGLFVKTPAMQVVEVLAACGLDFLVLDAEHAPFGPRELDSCLLAARAGGIPALVRVGYATPANLLQVLDMGAAGVVIPHMQTAEGASHAIDATRYSGSRGFSASTRAAGYGTISAKEFREASDRSTIVIGQVEDVAGVDNIDEIAAVDLIDALFIGRADLSVSLGAEAVDDAADKICAAGNAAGRTVGMFLPSLGELQIQRDKGVTLFAVSTDQALLASCVRSLADDFKSVKS